MKLLSSQYALSGDEWYKQHHDQLQESQLDFARYLEDEKANTASLSPEVQQHTKHPKPEKKRADSLEMNPIEKRPVLSSKVPTAKPHVPPNGVSPLEKKEQQLPSTFLSAKWPTLLPRKDKCTVAQTAALCQPSWKKHHLFLDGHEAELSLNTYGLNPQEQKKEVWSIKAYLHQKGFRLKRLFINGVHHD